MHPTPLLFLLTTPAVIAAYAPKPLEIRTHRFCDDSGYGGYCQDLPMQFEVCRNLDDVLSKQLSSFRIPNDEECKLYDDPDCQENRDWVLHKGDQSYLTGCGGCAGKFCWSGCGKYWNDRVVSIKCTWSNPKPY
ncbi:hypothetical protein E6O75_ATG00649 [Venturia nashicola]|uniref:Uncharacterized protein n=1 Tax=Venturia nashicola TaxID=86259 RepID=A0A4Z1PXF9_9PEZI|nr:hypothetical protein E6O75_ATG00649 [Venturia nashicola]